MDNNESVDSTVHLINAIKELLVSEKLWSLEHMRRYQKNITALESGGVITEHDMDLWKQAGQIVMQLRQLREVIEAMVASMPDPSLVAQNLIGSVTTALTDHVRLPTLALDGDRATCPVCDGRLYSGENELEAVILGTFADTYFNEGESPEVQFRDIDPQHVIVMRHTLDPEGEVQPCQLNATSLTWKLDGEEVNQRELAGV